ncbi:MAG: AraC family transcriptional regulator [Bacteroidota bacterium]|nr:AraC family transcriptional regulator [Bacteroidota bacterium]
MEIAYEKLCLDESCIFHFQEFIQPKFTSPYHLHDEFELILIVHSHGKLYLGSNVINFSDGDLFLFAPGLPHCFYNTRGFEKGNIPAHAVVVQFKRDFLGESFFDKDETSQLKKLIDKSYFGVRFIKPKNALQKRIQQLNQKKHLEKIGELLLILNELAAKKNIQLLSTENTMNLCNLNDSIIISNVYKYVAENFQKDVSFDVAASTANMQRSAFCRFFKRKTKKTFSEFVNETRIVHARKLLAETDKTVIEIAFECGYENTSYFNRQFKTYCGITPTVFKEQIATIK